MMLRHYSIIAVAMFFCAGPLRAQGETAQQFKSKALAEWNNLLEKVRTLRLERHDEKYISMGGKPIRPTNIIDGRYVVSSSGLMDMYDDNAIDEKGKVKPHINFLELWNGQYHAALKRTRGGDGWLLDQLHPGKKSETSRFRRAFVWLSAGTVLLEECLPHPGFVIKQLEPLHGSDGGSPLRVHFQIDASQGKPARMPDQIPSGTIDFDTARSYRPIAYEFRLKSKDSEGFARGTTEFDGNKTPPVLKKMIQEEEVRHDKLGVISIKTIMTFKVEYNADVRDEEFRLSYYGLPEPVGVKWKKPVPLYVWFALGAVGCLFLTVACRYVARHYRAKQVSIPPAAN